MPTKSGRHLERSAAQRLKEALAVLLADQTPPGGDSDRQITAAELCRMAGVSRNSLYRYHPGVLQTLQQHQQQRHRKALRS